MLKKSLIRKLVSAALVVTATAACSDDKKSVAPALEKKETTESLLTLSTEKLSASSCPTIKGTYRCSLYPRYNEKKLISIDLKRTTTESFELNSRGIEDSLTVFFYFDPLKMGSVYKVNGEFQDQTVWARELVERTLRGFAGFANEAAPEITDKKMVEHARALDLDKDFKVGYQGYCENDDTFILHKIEGSQWSKKDILTQNKDGSLSVVSYRATKGKEVDRINDKCELVDVFPETPVDVTSNYLTKLWGSPDKLTIELKGTSRLSKRVLLNFEREFFGSLMYKLVDAKYEDETPVELLMDNAQLLINTFENNVYLRGISPKDLKIGTLAGGTDKVATHTVLHIKEVVVGRTIEIKP